MDIKWIEETRDRIGKLSCYVNQNAMEAMLQNYALESRPKAKEELKKEIESILEIYEPKLWRSERPIIEGPIEDVDGDIKIGTIYQGDNPLGTFGLNKHFMVRHCAIYAQTGHGKSTVLYHIQDQLIRYGIPFLFFDMKKDGRALLRRYERLAILPWYRFPWNPLRPPPGMPTESWWANFSQICGFSFGWFVASSNYLQQHLDNLYEHYEKTGDLPNLHHLYASIAHTTESTRRKSEYHDSVENRISTLVSIFGNNFNVEVGIPLEVLCELPCVIELHGLRPAEANWLVEVILSWIYFYRLYQDQRGEKLRQVIFVDECHRIFDRSKEYRQTAIEMGTPILSIFPSQFRDFGVSLVLSSQTPSQVMDVVHANTLVKIVGNLSSGLDIAAISEAMGLDEETTECIHALKRAQWIVRMSDSYTEPFLIETPDYLVERNVTDEEVKTRMNAIFSEYLPKEKPKKKEEKPEPKVILPQLSDDAWSLLLDINTHPFKGLTGRYKSLNLSGRRASRAKKELIERGLVREVSLILGSYRPIKFLVLTNKAINILSSIGHDVRLWRHTGHMGFKHQLYTVLIAYTFRRAGYETFIEKQIKSRRIDVLTIINGEKVAIEVETGTGIDIRNKLKGLEEFDKLIIITDKKENIIPVQEAIRLLSPSKVRIYHISEYLRYLKANYSKVTNGNKYNNQFKSNSSYNFENKAGKKGN